MIRNLGANGCSSKAADLEFNDETTIQTLSNSFRGRNRRRKRSLALDAELLERYAIPTPGMPPPPNSDRYLECGPTYRDISVQPSMRWPLFTMTLQTGNALVQGAEVR